MNEEKKVEEQAPAAAAEPEQVKRYIKTPARFAGRCKTCHGEIRVGDAIVWDSTEKKAYCAECGMEHMEAQRDEA